MEDGMDCAVTDRKEIQEDAIRGNGQAQNDPVRVTIIRRCGELRLSYADTSRQIDRNETYVHQFLFRGTPKVLPEDVRGPLATVLQVEEDELRGSPRGRGTRVTSAAAAAALPSAPIHSPDDTTALPTYSETDQITPARATSWSLRPPQLARVSGCFAIWIGRPHGKRLHAGDLAFVHPTQPPRIGDPVVAVREGQILMIGDLGKQTDDHLSIAGGDSETASRVRADGVQIMKIVSVQFA
jgi:hypothetical protein